MDFDNRYTLLELFAETTSSEEHGISFEGIHLPQVKIPHLTFTSTNFSVLFQLFSHNKTRR